MNFRKLVAVVSMPILLLACAAPPTRQPHITVAAASDLQFAFTDIAKLYEQQTGRKVVLVFGSTGQLSQQIENGAPYDVFAAANASFIEQLDAQRLIEPGSAALYARGRIVLATNKAMRSKLNSLAGLADASVKRIAIANPAHAPYGMAAREAMVNAGVWDAVQNKLVLGENVRQALQYVQSGEVDAAIIALSIANVPEIGYTPIDVALHKPLDQTFGIMQRSVNKVAAAAFIAFVNGPQGHPIMRKYGFLLPGESTP